MVVRDNSTILLENAYTSVKEATRANLTGMQNYVTNQLMNDYWYNKIPYCELPETIRKQLFGIDLMDEKIPVYTRFMAWKKRGGEGRDMYKVPGTVMHRNTNHFGDEYDFRNNLTSSYWVFDYDQYIGNANIVTPANRARIERIVEPLGVVFKNILATRSISYRRPMEPGETEPPKVSVPSMAIYVQGRTAKGLKCTFDPVGSTDFKVYNSSGEVILALSA